MLYIAASGASQDMIGTALHANNLANAQTTGFKAQLAQARAMPAFGEGLPTRVFAMTESHADNLSQGALVKTGSKLDFVIEGDGWVAVEDAQGGEAYSRSGQLQVRNDGALTDSNGRVVLGDLGQFVIPLPISDLTISEDGFVSVRPQGAPETVREELGRLKLVKPDSKDLVRGLDGLFRQSSGNPADPDPTVTLTVGAIENSNVNPLGEMMGMVSLQRHYELQVKIMKQAEELDTRANSLLRIV